MRTERLAPRVLEALAGRRVLVTGGTGLVGRQVVRLLADAGARVVTVSLDDLAADPRAEQVKADLRDYARCREIAREASWVCHLAGIKGGAGVTKRMPASHFVPTLQMNTGFLEACREAGVERLVYTSSIGAYAADAIELVEERALEGSPMDFAGWAKRMGELQLLAYREQYGIRGWTAVRLANVYGPGDDFDPASAMVVPGLIARAAAGERPLLVWGDGSAERDLLFSADAAEGIVLALALGDGDGVTNLGSGRGTPIRELVLALAAIAGFEYAFDPARPAGYARRVLDVRKARSLLGWEARTPLAQGLKETWDWFSSHPEEHRGRMSYFRQGAGAR